MNDVQRMHGIERSAKETMRMYITHDIQVEQHLLTIQSAIKTSWSREISLVTLERWLWEVNLEIASEEAKKRQ
jgi:hypothetical protein